MEKIVIYFLVALFIAAMIYILNRAVKFENEQKEAEREAMELAKKQYEKMLKEYQEGKRKSLWR